MLLLGAAYLVQGEYQEKVDIEAGVEDMKGRLQVLKAQVATQRQSVEPLQSQRSRLKQQLEARETASQQLIGSRIDWHVPLETLFNSLSSGVKLNSVIALPDGQLIVEGVATAPGSITTLPEHLSSLSPALDFQGIRWAPGREPPEFTATFLVRK